MVPTEPRLILNLCCYLNGTSSIQILRIANIESWYFEKVIFPGQTIPFEAPPEGELEIYSSRSANNLLVERISCETLQVPGR
jgi:hypothetical protein